MRNVRYSNIVAALAFAIIVLPNPASALQYAPKVMDRYGPGHGMFDSWGDDYGYSSIHLLIWMIIPISVVALVVWLGLNMLENYCARRENNHEEYLQTRRLFSDKRRPSIGRL